MSPCFALLDTPGGGALLFEQLIDTIPVSGQTSLSMACVQAERHAEAGCHVVAALDYELGHSLEPRSGTPSAGVLGSFWIFARQRCLDADALEHFLDEIGGIPTRPAAVADFCPALAEDAYRQAVGRIRDYIAAGDCYQVNFTFPFGGTCVGDPLALYVRLRRAQPVMHGGLLVLPDTCVLSFSPELFVRRESGHLQSRPMKGTAARGTDRVADATNLAALQSSAKERAENVMIVDLIRNDLGRIAVPGSVRVDALCAIEDYPSVFQMTSTVSASSNAPLAEVLAALFPCGSITGAPKIRAMQIVEELESSPRGLYTGALGWVGRGGDFSFSVVIRTLQVKSSGYVRYGVGSGIVWDSEPAAEYRECLLKAAFVRRAEPGFRLIETLRLENGAMPLLAYHLDRICASAASFSFSCGRASIESLLRQLANAHATGVHRVRLTLGHGGDVDTAVAPLAGVEGVPGVEISPQPLDSTDGWLRHKTTARARYDRELERLAADTTMFDIVFVNERGEICEGARSNVFVRRAPGQSLLTPPLSCGLLPGVLRRSLLESGAAVEAVLRENDLRSAAEVYLGNALRGLVRVSF